MSGISWKEQLGAAAGVVLAVAVLACGTASAAAEGWVWPVGGRVITPYRNDDARPYAAGMHRGIDIAAPVGSAVVAARSGHVTYAGSLGSSGLTVGIATADGRYATSYLHLSKTDVRRGDRIAAGEQVGAVGVTGTRSASEPHLHFGVRLAGTEHSYVDPLTLLGPLPRDERATSVVPAPRPAPLEARPEPVPVAAPQPHGGAAPQPRRVPVSLPRLHGFPATSPVAAVPHAAPNRGPVTSPGSRVPAPAAAPRASAPDPLPGRVPVAPQARLHPPQPAPAVAPRGEAASLGLQSAGGDWGRWFALGGALLLAALAARRALVLALLELASRLGAGQGGKRAKQRPRASRPESPPLGAVSQVG